MSTIILDIPSKVNKLKIKNWLDIIINNLELFEDFLLWLKIDKIKDKSKIKPIDKLKKKYASKLS